MRDFLLEYAQYNLWANKKLTSYLRNYTDDLLRKEVISSFPSIGKTLFHIWDAQIIWYSRLNGESLDYFPSEKYGKNVMDAFDGLLESGQEMIDWIDTNIVEDADALKEVHYKTIKGSPYSQKAFEILAHTFNHGSYHRGQIITMAKQLGFRELPSTDFIFFVREKQNTGL